jgi:hypothetical protein
MCDALRDGGWYVSRVNNGAAANRSEVYANRGAEIWFEAKRLMEEKKVILPEDPVFIQQATNRRVEYTGNPEAEGRVKGSHAQPRRELAGPG